MIATGVRNAGNYNTILPVSSDGRKQKFVQMV